MEENKLVKSYECAIDGYSHADDKYGKGLMGENRESLTYSLKFLDTALRQCIGKTEDIRVSMCSHQAILSREFDSDFCRVCNTDLSVGNKARWNDFLVIRHPQCTKAICKECAENNPDEFHIAFRGGLDKYKKLRYEQRLAMNLLSSNDTNVSTEDKE